MIKFIKKIRQKWHNDIIVLIKKEAIQNKEELLKISSRISEIEKKINIINNVVTKNQFLLQCEMICDEFSHFTNDILRIEKMKVINLLGMKSSIFLNFLSNQKQLKKVYYSLDEQSRLTWYYLLLLRISLFFFSVDSTGIYHKNNVKECYDFLKYLQNITGWTGYNLDSQYYTSSQKHQYLMDELVKSGMHVIDAGAYDGNTAIHLSEIVGTKGMVYSFEPTNTSFLKLKDRGLANVTCIQKGLYSNECNLEFIENSISAGNYFSQQNTNQEKTNNVVSVISIDQFVNENNIPRIDYIKMDIEGMELEALKGAENTINKYFPNMAISIYHNSGNDLIDIPIYLVSKYCKFYDFKIMHHSKEIWESVIYAIRK